MSKNNKKELIDRIHFILLVFIRIILIIAIASALYNSSWGALFVSSITFILTFIPYAFEKRYKINIPVEFEIIIILFVFAAIFLGEVRDYYLKFWWWDVVLHSGSAMGFGFIGFIMLYILYKGDKIKASPRTIALFTFCFALAIGSLWEIFEFGVDQIIFNGVPHMQKSGLRDTMADLIVDSIGALIGSLAGYLYLKKDEVFLLKKIVARFTRENPSLFKNNS